MLPCQLKKMIALALVSLCGTGLGLAQQPSSLTDEDNLPSYSLNPIVITAQRVERNDLETPSIVEVITAQDIRKLGVSNVYDALAFTTGMNLNSYGPAGHDYGGIANRANLRGLDKGTLILVNGNPISVDDKSSVSGIPLNSIKKIEITKGANSVLYGNDAFGGVINILTKDGGHEEGSIAVGVGNKGYKSVALQYRNPSINMGYDHSKIRPMKHKSQAFYNSKRKTFYKYLNVEGGHDNSYFINGKLNDKTTFSFLRNEGSTKYDEIHFSKSPEENKKDSQHYAYKDQKNIFNVTYKKDMNTKLAFYYNNRSLDGTEASFAIPEVTAPKASNYEAYNVGGDIQKNFYFRNGQDTLVTGISLNREHYKGTAPGKEDNVAHRDNIGLYGQYTYSLNDKWNVIAGFRAERIDDPIRDQNVFLPQFQGVYSIDDNSSFYMSVGRSFKMPGLKQTFKVIEEPLYEEYAGKNLKPQEGWNYEVGYKAIRGKGSWNVVLYHMNFDNIFKVVGYKGAANNFQINSGQFKNTGIEANYRRQFNDRLFGKVGFSYGNPKNKSELTSDWEQTYAKLQFMMNLQYAYKKWDASLGLNVLSERPTHQLKRSGPDVHTPTSVHLNGRISYHFSKDSSLTLEGRNLLDRKDITSFGYLVMYDEPFNWELTYKHTF